VSGAHWRVEGQTKLLGAEVPVATWEPLARGVRWLGVA
jgi:hypothetical protein